MQFGYITLFASAFPLAFAISMVSNMIEVRSDAFKLSFVMKRPLVKPARNAGIWENILQITTWAAVLTNVFIFGFASDQMAMWFPSLFDGVAGGQIDTTFVDGQGRVIMALLFSFEHCLLAAGLLLMYFISPVPQWVADAQARQEYIKRKALRDRLHEDHQRFRQSIQTSGSASVSTEGASEKSAEFNLAAARKAAQGKTMSEEEKKARGLLYDTSKASAVREESEDDEEDEDCDFGGGDPFEGM